MKKNKEIINDFISHFIREAKDNSLLIQTYLSQHRQGKGLFYLDKLFTEKKVYFFQDYFNKKDIKKYNLIVADLPINYGKEINTEFGISISKSWSMVYELSKKLNQGGVLIVVVEPIFGALERSKNFIKLLEKKGIFLKALIETPEKILSPFTLIQPTIAIFSRENNHNKVFIASLNDNENGKELLKNFYNKKKKNNLTEGDILSLEDFKGFYNYKISRGIDGLQTQYKEFQKKELKDITLEINATKNDFTEDDSNNYLYIPNIGELKTFCKSKELEKKPQNYYQIKINKQLALAEYLKNYFKSDMGQLSLKSLFTGSIIQKINKNNLDQLKIPLPPLKTQEEIVESYKLLEKVHKAMNIIEKDLTLSPVNAREISQKLIGTLSTLNKLSEADEILGYIRKGESLTIEFKQTFSVNIKTKTKDKEIEKSSLKNIVGFLNKDGGVLLIGVTDEGEIYGIENDNYQSDDKYLLHFKNKLRDAIGIDFINFVSYKIIKVNSKKVLCVKCKPSNEPVYLYDEDFYIRISPATEKLTGRKQLKYIKDRWPNKE